MQKSVTIEAQKLKIGTSTTSMKKVQLQTMSIAFRQICEGERDWTALGNFMNYWYSYAKDRRPELMTDPLPEYDTQSLYQHRWAVFCAASVE
jgi:hypothetical protein